MKKNFLFFAFLALFISCQKNPDMDELDANFVVVTDHNPSANFTTYSTYFIPDSILIVGDKPQPYYMKSTEVASKIISIMNDRGYVRVLDKKTADLGIQTSFVINSNYIVYDPTYPYPYWPWSYWGDWTGWYYPYVVTYTYDVGSLLAEIVDLKAPVTASSTKLPVIWTAYMSGLLSGSQSIDTNLAVNAVNQAFIQSPYIKK